MHGPIKKIFTRLLIEIVNASNHTKCVSLSNAKFNLPNSTLLIYILMNTVKNFTTLPFRLK